MAAVLLSAPVQGADDGTAVAAPRPAATPRPTQGPVKGIGIRLVDAPVARKNDPRARISVVDHLNPGTTIKRRFEVANTTDRRQHITLYAAAASIAGDAFAFAPDRAQNELTRWIRLEPGSVGLAPNSRRVARFVIAVPATAWRGERYGVIWAQVSSPPDEHHNVGMVTRVGIRVYLDVGPGGEPPSGMRVDKLTPERLGDGRPRLVAQIRNTGGRALVLSGRLTLTHGPDGRRAGPFPSATGVVLPPDGAGQEVFTLDRDLPNGPWTADVDVQSGLVKQHVSAKVTFPAKGIGMAITSFASMFTSFRMLMLTAILALALILAWTARHLARRRRTSLLRL